MNKQRIFFCIDMKTFYASVECAERHLNPFETDLVVADTGRGKNALCLAISPHMKTRGIQNRCRLSDIPKDVKYEIAMPRMQLYIEYAADIYALYLDYFCPDDIYVYSIDESFIDVTDYLKIYKTEPIPFAKKLINEIADKLHIPSTAGIGTNMYLAKIALDITAKHARDHVGYLDEELFKDTLWTHKPITDFWGISSGTARRLSTLGVYDMRGIAFLPEAAMYKKFGINAELMIDHAWGRESCRIEDIKSYRSKSKSVSFSQILPRDYSTAEARTVLTEMLYHGCDDMAKRKVITHRVGVYVGYGGDYSFGGDGDEVRTNETTNLPSVLKPYALRLFDKIVCPGLPIRRLGIAFNDICDAGCEGYDLFSNWDDIDREHAKQEAILDIRGRYGKNAVMRGIDYFNESTQRERNTFIGGHRAGLNDLPKRKDGGICDDETGTCETVHGI